MLLSGDREAFSTKGKGITPSGGGPWSPTQCKDPAVGVRSSFKSGGEEGGLAFKHCEGPRAWMCRPVQVLAQNGSR